MTIVHDIRQSPGTRGTRRGVSAAGLWTALKDNVLSVVIVLILLALVGPPVITLVQSSFSELNVDLSAGGFSARHYAKLLSAPDLGILVINSLLFAGGATAISLAVGSILAWLVERTDVAGKELAYITAIVSLGTPSILKVAAWLYLFGRQGPFNEAARAILGTQGALFQVNSLIGMILIEGMIWIPMVFLMMSATFRSANAEMEEAARMSGATVVETVRLVSLRMARPAILALAMFVFIRNIEAFEVPALVGMPAHVDVLTTELYHSMRAMPPDIGYASAFSVVLLLTVSVLLYFYGRLSRQAERYASITGKGYRPRPFRLGRLRRVGLAILILNFVVLLILPMIGLLWVALTPFVQPMRLSGLQHLTLKNFSAVISDAYYLKLVFNTLVVAGGAATAAMVLSLAAGWLAARRKPGGIVIDQLITIPLVFPGLVLGVAMLQVALGAPVPLYGTLWVIGLAFLIRYMPFGMRYTYNGVLQVHSELEQAAAVSGATTRQSMLKIVVPLVTPALAAGWIYIFLLCGKEVSLPLLLAGPQSQTIPPAMYNMWNNGQLGEVAALGLLWSAALAALAYIFDRLSRRKSVSTFQH